MSWRANQLMRDDLAKSSKTRLPKKFYNQLTTSNIDGHPLDSTQRNSALPTDHSSSVPEFNRDSKQSGKLAAKSHGKPSLSDGDLTKALKCQSRVRRHKRKQLSAQKIMKSRESREMSSPGVPESNEITTSVLDQDVPIENEKEEVCMKIEYDQLHQEHATYKEEIKSLKFALQRTAEEYEQLHQRNDVFQREIQSLKDASEESSRKHQEEINLKDAELVKLNEQCSLAQQYIKDLQVDVENGVENLKKDLTRKSSIEMREHELTKKHLAAVEAEKQTLVDDLNARLTKERADHQVTKQQLCKAESRSEEVEKLLMEEGESTAKTIQSLAKELESKVSLTISLKNEVNKLTLKVTKAEEAADKKNKELLSMTSKVDCLQTKIHQREIEIRGRVEEISKLIKNEKKILSTIQHQEVELQSKNESLKRLKSTNKNLLKNRDESKAECKRKDEELSKLRTKLEATQKYVESFKNEKLNVSKEGLDEKTKAQKKKNKKKKNKSNMTSQEEGSPVTPKDKVSIIVPKVSEVAELTGNEPAVYDKKEVVLNEPAPVSQDTPSQKGVLSNTKVTPKDFVINNVSESSSEKSCKQKEYRKNLLRKKTMKESKGRECRMKKDTCKRIPLSLLNVSKKPQLEYNMDKYQNVESVWTWWNIFFILISVILLLSYFHVQDIEGYFGSSTSVYQQSLNSLKEGVLGLLKH